jgi:anti-sigma factor RsiW
MSMTGCEQVGVAELTDYTAGNLPDAEAAALEAHLFACAACATRAAEIDALMRAIGPAARSAEVGGFVTDAVLNQLARDGVRVRTFVLTPGDVVPCAVWDDDQLLALRLRADLGGATRVTVSQHVAGEEVVRTTSEVAPGAAGEIVFATPASWVRQLPVVRVDVRLLAPDGEAERVLASYTLEHGGSLRR